MHCLNDFILLLLILTLLTLIFALLNLANYLLTIYLLVIAVTMFYLIFKTHILRRISPRSLEQGDVTNEDVHEQRAAVFSSVRTVVITGGTFIQNNNRW